jgi:hypothetical protein
MTFSDASTRIFGKRLWTSGDKGMHVQSNAVSGFTGGWI